jgi:hypothetical protein
MRVIRSLQKQTMNLKMRDWLFISILNLQGVTWNSGWSFEQFPYHFDLFNNRYRNPIWECLHGRFPLLLWP